MTYGDGVCDVDLDALIDSTAEWATGHRDRGAGRFSLRRDGY